MGVAIKQQLQSCWARIVQYLDCGGGYKNLHWE